MALKKGRNDRICIGEGEREQMRNSVYGTVTSFYLVDVESYWTCLIELEIHINI